ncbi:MAG TPA: mannosyltransferase family protein [Anaerolineae bacterium]|nr:mannosyltransferase family protein [Anaerolineae bacterium]
MQAQLSEHGLQAMALGWRARLAAARWLWVSLLAFVVTRLGIALVAYVAAPLIADSSVPPYHIRPDNVLLDVFGSRWDTGFYLSIADEGYQYQGVELPSVAFFPFLPLLIRVATAVVGDSLVAGLIIANAALLGATMLLHRLVGEEWGVLVADRAVWYLLIFPAAFFGSAIYTESLFLLLAIGALYLARKGYWESTAMLGFLAGLTRLVGILIAPMLLVEWWMQRQNRAGKDRPPLWALLVPVAVLLGTGAYMLYLWRSFGDPLAFSQASAAWGREPTSPLATIAEGFQRPADGWQAALLAGSLPLDNGVELLSVLLFLGLGSVLLWQRRWSEGVFVVLGTLIPLSSGLLMSQRRYVWVLFPAFVLLARWGGRPWVDRAITAVFLLGLGLFTAMFANWYWVG